MKTTKRPFARHCKLCLKQINKGRQYCEPCRKETQRHCNKLSERKRRALAKRIIINLQAKRSTFAYMKQLIFKILFKKEIKAFLLCMKINTSNPVQTYKDFKTLFLD